MMNIPNSLAAIIDCMAFMMSVRVKFSLSFETGTTIEEIPMPLILPVYIKS